jgi:DNA ligase D
MGRFGPRGAQGSRKPKRDPSFVAPIVYYVFDLLYLDGRLLVDVPLVERKHLLRTVLRDHARVRYGSHVEGDGKAFYEVMEERGLEGMIAKLKSSRYEPGRRSRAWLKVKIRREQEVVVVGYEPGKGARADLGSLILALREDDEWRYVGEVGSGLDQRTIRQLKSELDAHRVAEPPVVDPPRIKGAVWSEPRLVVRIEFSEWTDDDLLRQAAYKGLEIGKNPRAVVRERAMSTRQAARQAEQELRATASDQPDALARLDEIEREGNWEIEGRTIHVTNLDKVLFPGGPGGGPYTKRDLIRYYVAIAPVLLPYLRGRAVNLWRWPDGVDGKSFWQKQVPSYAPDWIARWDYPEAGSRESHTYIVADSAATLAWLANHAVVDVHPWTSRTASYQTPSYALIDIDPGERTEWEDVLTLARLYKSALDHLGLRGLPKVTGKRGIQVWLPVRPIYTYEQTSGWVEALSRAIGAAVPELVSWEWAKSARHGKARLDYTQNAVNKTLVAPYAVRPVADAAVSAPITWDELDDPELRPGRWNIESILPRVAERGDLFAPALELDQELPPLS